MLSSVLSGIVALFPGIISVEHFGGKWVNISEVWVGEWGGGGDMRSVSADLVCVKLYSDTIYFTEATYGW